MGDYIHTKFWIGGDVWRPIANSLCAAIIEEEMYLADDVYSDDEYFRPKNADELLANKVGGHVALFEYQKNYGDCRVLEAFCKEHGIPWEKWHSYGGDYGPAYYWWHPCMDDELTLSCTYDQELLIDKKPIDEIIKLFEAVMRNDPSGWGEGILKKLYLACPKTPVLPEFRVVNDDGESEEDLQLRKAVAMIREAADMVHSADPQAKEAILSLANDLEPEE